MLNFELPKNSIERDAIIIEQLVEIRATMEVILSFQHELIQLRDDYPLSKFIEDKHDKYLKELDQQHKSLKTVLQLEGVVPPDVPSPIE